MKALRITLVAGLMLEALPAIAQTTSPSRFVTFPVTSFAFRNVSVVDGLGTPVKANWTVVVRDGKIASAGPSSRVTIPDGMRVVDGTGDSLIPGLVGMHEHLYYELDERSKAAPTMMVSAPRLYLAAGVTTARTTGSIETYTELNLKARIEAGTEAGPTLDVSGPYLSGPDDPLIVQQAALASPDDARATVDFWTAHGVTSFKAFLAITRDELKAVIDEAHARGALVEGHLCSVTMGDAADLGIDELEHGIVQASDFVPDKQPDKCPSFNALFKSWVTLDPADPRVAALIQKLVAHHVAVTSTMAVFERGAGIAKALTQEELALLDPTARAGVDFVNAHPEQLPPAAIAKRILHTEMVFERSFVSSGGLLTSGADAGTGNLPGFADQRNVELLVEAGFSPVEAIRIATFNGARAMHRAENIGSIESGKDADLVLLSGDVASDITAIEHPVLVVKHGVAYDPHKLIDSVQGLVGRE